MSGDVIQVAPGTYAGGIRFRGKNVQVIGTAGADTTTIAGGRPVVQLDAGTLRGFTIRDGAPGIRFNCVSSCFFYFAGGGVFMSDASLEECIVKSNGATPYPDYSIFGMGIACSGTSAIRKCEITANFGGAVPAFASSTGGIWVIGGTLLMQDTIVAFNSAAGGDSGYGSNAGGLVFGGGRVTYSGPADATLDHCVFADNSTYRGDGGCGQIANRSGSQIRLVNTLVSPCDGLGGFSYDAQSRATQFMPDCNQNGVPDPFDCLRDPQLDLNRNFTIDACECFGDLDGDHRVSSADLAILLLSAGPCAACDADLDASGDIDSGDIGLLLLWFGECQ